MSIESRLTDALQATANAATPTVAGRDAVLAAAAARRHHRIRTATTLAAAASVAVALGAFALLRDDPTSEVRTVPPVEATDVPRTTLAPSTTAVPTEPETLVAVSDRGAVVVLETASGKVMHTLAPRGSADGDTTLARTPDGDWVYYADGMGCGRTASVYRVRADGTGSPERVATGTAPAVSPDGTRLAYAAPNPADPRDPSAMCHNTIVVRTLADGAEQRFLPTDDTNSFTAYGQVSAIDWAPDGRRLVYQQGWEGEGSFILDTVAHTTTRQATPVGAKQFANGLVHPTWHPPTGRLAAVNDCCYSPDDPQTPRITVLVDPATGDSQPLPEAGIDPRSLDYDPTGRFLLFVDKQGVVFVKGDGLARRLPAATGYARASW